MQILLFFSLAVALFAVVFAFQNNAPTALRFFIWSFDGSLAMVILAAVGAGALASFLAALPSHLKVKWQLRSCRHRVAELEGEKVSLIAEGEAPGKGKR